MTNTLISVIIPAHNEEKSIVLCLQSLHNQRYKNYELIVVCNGCTDRTASLAKKYATTYSLKKANVCAARNYGAQKAHGEILLFLDADCSVETHLLEKIATAVKEGYVGGTTKTLPQENILKAQLMMWFSNTIGNRIFLTAKGILFCRKEFFPKFNETINIAEDTFFLLDLKKKGRIKYITDSYIKTSMRRFEKWGYLKTIFTVTKGFFCKGWHTYEAVR